MSIEEAHAYRARPPGGRRVQKVPACGHPGEPPPDYRDLARPAGHSRHTSPRPAGAPGQFCILKRIFVQVKVMGILMQKKSMDAVYFAARGCVLPWPGSVRLPPRLGWSGLHTKEWTPCCARCVCCLPWARLNSRTWLLASFSSSRDTVWFAPNCGHLPLRLPRR